MKALVLDGYNLIYKIPEVRRFLDKSLLEARSEITRLAGEYKRKMGGVGKVYVIFDGRDEYAGLDHLRAKNQIFSRTGKGDQTIIAAVSKLTAQYDVTVVSDDNYIRNNARAHNAACISASDFMAVINKRSKKTTPHASRDEKLTDKQAKEINDELRKHWGI